MIRRPLLALSLTSLALAPLGCGEPEPSGDGLIAGNGGLAAAGGVAAGGASAGGAPPGGASTGGGAASGGVGTGGVAAGGSASGGTAAGGTPVGDGGAATDTGGSASGGAPPTDYRFRCPDGSASLAPTLGTAAPVGAAPAIPVDPEEGKNYRTEGPVWRDGALYLSQTRDFGDPYPPSRVLKWDGASFTEVLSITAGTNGMALADDGALIAASHLVGGLVRIDFATTPPSMTTLVAEYQGARFNSPNDLAIHSSGSIYFSDPTWQCEVGDPASTAQCTQPAQQVYRYSAGAVTVVATPLTKPNGVTLSPDESTLYVSGLDQNVVQLPVNPDGTVGAATNFGSVTNGDGMAVDCAGNLYVATKTGIQVLSKAGTTLGTISLPPGGGPGDTQVEPSNVAFGGSDHKTLYITTQPPGTVYSLSVGVPGFPY